MPEPRGAKGEFLVRYFHWSLREWEREIASDLAMIRKVRGPSAYKAIKLLESLPRERWAEVAQTLTKHFHPEAVKLLGQTLHDEEKVLFQHCLAYRAQVLWPGYAEEVLTERKSIARRRVAAIVKSALTSLGVVEAGSYQLIWDYKLRRNAWVVTTFVDVGGRNNWVRYAHAIAINEESPFVRASLFSWLGLSGGTTAWTAVTEEDAVFAAQAIAELTQHFLAAVPSLIGDE